LKIVTERQAKKGMRHGSSRFIAQREHVSHTTILRSRQFAHAVKTIAAAAGEKAIVLVGDDVKLGRQQWQQLAEIAEFYPEAVPRPLAQVRTAETMKAGNWMVRQAYTMK
jgi:hypothetical protein